ncbi:hypothetical protein D6D02_03388 [Aureobasidium pullulans]|nr:hypothetical protein D6D02_03388 [Aureobasidium pullulans]
MTMLERSREMLHPEPLGGPLTVRALKHNHFASALILFLTVHALEAAAAAVGVAQPPTIVAPGPMAAAQPPAVAVAGLASRCLWVGCNAAFADDDQLYHVGAVGARPRVKVCLWNGCAVGPHRDRAEMRSHLQHHVPEARPWSCNGGCGASFKHRYARASHHSVCAHG